MENNKIIMEQPKDEQVEVTDVKEKQNDLLEKESATSISTDGSIGKFKDVESLLSAYNNLQAEFTRKCQKVSELESSLSSFSEKGLEAYAKEFVENNKEFKENLLKTYLEDAIHHASPTVISNLQGSGIPLKAPPKPSNLEEAKSVVQNLFN